MPNEMTPLDAAEMNLNTAKYLEDMVKDVKYAMKGTSVEDWLLKVTHEDERQLTIAASILRRVASGELAEVVHCRDCNQWHDNYCDTFSADVGPDFFCANGSLTDGKDEPHEQMEDGR